MSIDGATPEVMEKLQRGSNFAKVVGNAKKLMAEKKRRKSRFPELGFTVVVTKENVHQMPDLIKLFEELVKDVQSVVFVQFIKLIGFKENQYLMPDYDSLEKYRQLAIETAERSRIKFRLNFVQFDCVGEEDKLPINCCVAWIVPNTRQWVDPYALGNVYQTDFRQIWNSDKFVRFKEMLNNNEVPPLCHLYRSCAAYKTGAPLKELPVRQLKCQVSR
jgi:MoaA/NifB/PqqE/SkfB family radical SAM enzyme